MTDGVTAAWEGAAELLAGTAERLGDALPAAARIIADVERDWVDECGWEWVERAALVHRALQRELEATLAAARVVGEVLRLGTVDDDARPIGVAGVGRAGAARAGGPRLGGTDADRVDDERGVRIAELGDPPG